MSLWLSFLLASSAPAASAPAQVDSALNVYAQPQRLVTGPADRKVHLFCMGERSPTVVLTAGLTGWALHWRKVQPKVAEFTRVCTWDRPGHGFSDAYPEPLTLAASTNAMAAALTKAAVPGPYVLVGHSDGALETLLYSFENPRAASGLVLFDPSAPHQDERVRTVAPQIGKLSDESLDGWLKQMESCAANGAECREPPPEFAPELRASVTKQARNIAAVRNVQSFATDTSSSGSTLLLHRKRSLGDIPILVLSAVEDENWPPEVEKEVAAYNEEWRKMHEEIAALSTKGERREVDAPHNMILAKPEIAVAAIKEVVAKVRSRPRP